MNRNNHTYVHGLRTPREEIAFTARPKIKSQSQIFRYGRSIFCLPHRPNFSDFFDLCLHWVSIVRDSNHRNSYSLRVGHLPKFVIVFRGFYTSGVHKSNCNCPSIHRDSFVESIIYCWRVISIKLSVDKNLY